MRPRRSVLWFIAAFALACGDITQPDVDNNVPGDTTNQNNPSLPSAVSQAIDSLEDAMYIALNGLDTLSDLDNFSFEPARQLFQQALAGDPTNQTAALGLAVTTIFVLEDHPDLRALASAWDDWLQTHNSDDIWLGPPFAPAAPLTWKRATLPLDLTGGSLGRLAGLRPPMGVLVAATAAAPYPPTLAEHQALLRNVVRPALTAARDAAAKVTDPAFTFTITERMQGEDPSQADPLELDLTEVYALRGALDVATASVDIALAYVVEPSIWGADGVIAALSPGSTFGTLAADGGTRLASAHTSLMDAVDLLNAGLSFLEAETDDQSNDIIKRDVGNGDGVSSSDIQEVRDVLADIDAALRGPRSVTYDFGLGDVTLTVDATKLFENPVADLKTLLPDYEVYKADDGYGAMRPQLRFTAVNLSDWTFPDPTFNGVFPGLTTTAALLSSFDVSSSYFENNPVSGFYTLISIDDVDCSMIVFNGGIGCDLSEYYVQQADVSLWGYGGTPSGNLFVNVAYDTEPDGTVDSFASLYWDASYTATPGGGASITVDLALTDQMQSSTPVSAMLTDKKGFSGVDTQFRRRGGSVLSFNFKGHEWVFERQ